MWVLNNNRWVRNTETLSKTSYDNLKQDISKTRLYSKCLSGSLYSSLIDLDSAYFSNKYKDDSTWYIDFSESVYINNIQPTLNPTIITSNIYSKYLNEYGFTTKLHFTPSNIISDKISNFKYVDICTYDRENLLTSDFIVDIDNQYKELYIDGVRVIDGHRILIENQITYVILSTSIDPDSYFEGKYYIIEQDIVNTRYYYFNNKNGVYVYKNGYLYRDDMELTDYTLIDSVSYYVKLGKNKDKQFKIFRKKDGYYPLYNVDDSVEFYEIQNQILRSKIDYNNAFDISYNDVLYEDSYEIDGIYIPERIISIGEFGFINITQNGKSNFIRNKYRYKLNNITSTNKNYIICADNGVLLIVDKISLKVSRLSIDTKMNLNSVLFYDELNGFVVGDFNTIFYTENGGISWNRIYNSFFDGKDFTKLVYYNSNRLYITSTNGILIECYRDLSDWKLISKKITKKIDINEEIDLSYKVNDCIICRSFDDQLNISLVSLEYYDYLLLVGDNYNFIIHPLNFNSSNEFYFVDIPNIGDIMNIQSIDSYKFIINSSNIGLLNIDLLNYDVILNNSNIISTNNINLNIISDKYYNSFSFDGYNIYGVGNSSKNVFIEYGTYSSTYSYIENDIDNTIYDNKSPKLLFLDYDIASKLNFFDDFGEYILPNNIIINVDPNLISSNYKIDIIGDENYTSWLDYYKDSLSTYKYYTNISISNKVLFNTQFKKTTNFINIINPNINIDVNYISDCAPTILDHEKSRYVKNISDPNIIPTINNDYNVLMYDYLMIIKTPLNNTDEIGDVLYLESSIISSYFIINNIITLGMYKYVYVYTDFNNNIINDIVSTYINIYNLNKFEDISDIVYKFNLHPISYGYRLTGLFTDNLYTFTLYPKFNNYTSYYNMSLLLVDDFDTYVSSYKESYIKFGYNPMYNIFDYLNNIDPLIFNENKIFTAIPSYLDIPCTNSNTLLNNTLYIDTGIITNRIYFGLDFKYEYDTLLINIFYDLIIDTISGVKLSNKMLLINKYYDSKIDKYVIEFLDKIKYGELSNSISKISIIGRNNLKIMSDDLKYINNISRTLSKKTIDNIYVISGYFNTNYKFNTDSYAKVLLSDGDIKSNINSIIYTDNNNKLSTNFINFDKTDLFDFVNVSSYDVSENIYPDLRIRVNLTNKHNLSKGNIIYLVVNDGNKIINGNHVIYDIIDSYSIILETKFDISYIDCVGNIQFENFDIFSSIQPVDIYDLSNESLPKKSVKINDNSYDFVNSNLSLFNIDRTNYRYQLVDGLDLISINSKYSWIFESDINNAIIGEDENGLVWYSGDWSCGRFFGGTWYSGTWYSGDWYNGTWNSLGIKNNLYNVDVSKNHTQSESVWYNGRFFNGIWNSGTWYNGRFYDGVWNNGVWNNGVWNNGVWNNGVFMGGIWIDGVWNNGRFNQSNRPSYWINGLWNNGYFENGRWFNGIFDKKTDSIFGYDSSLSKPAIWDSGIFKDGVFISKNYNKSTIWKTGKWFNGVFDGGLSYNIDFKKGIWKNGISDDIEIISVNLNEINNTILLNGVFRFNSNDEITIINDYDDETVYSDSDIQIYDFRSIGSLYYPGTYKIINSEIIDNKHTMITILGKLNNGDPNIPIIIGEYDDVRYKEYSDILSTIRNKRIDIKIVSNFNNCTWYNGCWYNGVFNNGDFLGGIWYNGRFNGNWG